MKIPEPKTCASCGRRMVYRRRWARSWDDVKYCSQRCRRNPPAVEDRRLEEAILTLLSSRARSASICPSEAARAVRPWEWRPIMERARSAARRLQAAGRVEIVQKGRAVDPSTAKGPIRIRRARGGDVAARGDEAGMRDAHE